jgi:multicomponent Na+:H+ antiporter subunit D
MVSGVLGAAVQVEIRRILSFHIISQIGYMVLGLGLMVYHSGPGPAPYGVRLGLAGSIFYLMHHIVVKTNLFLVGGMVERLRGTGRLDRLGGLYRERPGLAVLFLIPALSLAGIPPLSGFWAKFALVKASLELGSYGAAAAALAVGFLTLFSMTKIWAAVFWAPRPEDASASTAPPSQRWQFVPMIVLAAITVGIGLAAGPLFALSLEAADALLDPSGYVRAVLQAGAATP